LPDFDGTIRDNGRTEVQALHSSVLCFADLIVVCLVLVVGS
jgi:hypothetical protein